jgi:hypothetical protein
MEELINKVGLRSYVSGKHNLREEVRKSMVLMQDAVHFSAVDSHDYTRGNGAGGGYSMMPLLLTGTPLPQNPRQSEV